MAKGINFREIATLDDQDALTRPASPIVAASERDFNVPEAGLPYLAVWPDDLPNDEEDWHMSDLMEVAAVERVGVKRRLRGLQGNCRAKRRKVLEYAVEAIGLAVE